MKKNVFSRLLQYLKAYRLRLFFVFLFASVSTVFTVMAPFVIGRVTTTLFESLLAGSFYWDRILWLLASLICLWLVSCEKSRCGSISHAPAPDRKSVV